MRHAFGLNGAGDRRIGIASQKNMQRIVFIQCFADLLGTDEDAMFAQNGQIAALGDHTICFSIHTGTYYTHFFGNVNKKVEKISTFWLIFSVFPGCPLALCRKTERSYKL